MGADSATVGRAFCTVCGSRLIEGARFCQRCGSAAVESVETSGEHEPGAHSANPHEGEHHATYEGMERYTFLSVERLIHGFPEYLDTFGDVLRHPLSFGRWIDVADPAAFGSARDYLIYSTIVALFIVTTINLVAKLLHTGHEGEISKIYLMVSSLVSFGLFGSAVHTTLWLFGGRKHGATLTGTLALYAYVAGTLQPLEFLVMCPIVLLAGPEILLGTPSETEIAALVQEHASVLALAGLGVIALALASFAMMTSWFSAAYHLTRKRVMLALVVGLVPYYLLAQLEGIVFDFITPGLKALDALF